MTDSQIREQTDRYHFNVYNRLPVSIVKGKGTKAWSEDGTEYLDVLAGIAVNNLGHCHPAVVQAVKEQTEKLMHISNFYYSEPQARMVKRLTKITGMDRVFVCNSGAEAVEGAIKLARKYGRQHQKTGNIITVSGAFHGRTIGTVSMGMDKYQQGYAPLLSGFKQIPFDNVEALKNSFNDDTVGIILEPIQGSGGLHVTSSEFMHTAQNLCHEYGALLILDEVQTGLGRTGKMYAHEHYGIEPDIIATAKALGGGFPVGAFLAGEELANTFKHGDHGSTFGGNPLACAAACATIDTIIEEELAVQAEEKGDYLMDLLIDELKAVKPVTDVRGKGLMIGVELTFNGNTVVREMMDRRVLSNCTASNVLRIVPPLVIEYDELDYLANVMSESIRSVALSKQ